MQKRACTSYTVDFFLKISDGDIPHLSRLRHCDSPGFREVRHLGSRFKILHSWIVFTDDAADGCLHCSSYGSSAMVALSLPNGEEPQGFDSRFWTSPLHTHKTSADNTAQDSLLPAAANVFLSPLHVQISWDPEPEFVDQGSSTSLFIHSRFSFVDEAALHVPSHGSQSHNLCQRNPRLGSRFQLNHSELDISKRRGFCCTSRDGVTLHISNYWARVPRIGVS